MANEEHLAILKQGVEAWNHWREEHEEVQPDLSGANLSTVDLSGVNLSSANLVDANLNLVNLVDANLSGADLCNATFRAANLSGADLSHVILNHLILGDDESRDATFSGVNFIDANLSSANLINANLYLANLSGADLTHADLGLANLSGADLSGADLSGANLTHASFSETNFSGVDFRCVTLDDDNDDLRGLSLSAINFSGTNFSGVDLTGVDLSESNFSESNLTGANLSETQVLFTDFSGATFTGACIQDWQINSATNLSEVQCSYIYRKWDRAKSEFTHRLPADPNSTFAPGEFTKLFQVLESVLDTINLTFTEGIDWQAFLASFQALRNQHPDEIIAIQGMERKGNAFIVRLEVEERVDKGAIETEIKQLYHTELRRIEAQYEERLRLQGDRIEDLRSTIEYERQQSANLIRIAEARMNQQASNIQNFFNAPVGSAFNRGDIGNSTGEVEGNQIGEVGELNQRQMDEPG